MAEKTAQRRGMHKTLISRGCGLSGTEIIIKFAVRHEMAQELECHEMARVLGKIKTNIQKKWQ